MFAVCYFCDRHPNGLRQLPPLNLAQIFLNQNPRGRIEENIIYLIRN